MFVVVVYVDYPLGNAHGVFLVVRSFQLIYLGVVNSRKKSRRIDKTKTSQGTLVQVYRDKYSLRKHSTRVIPGFIIPHSKSHSFFFPEMRIVFQITLSHPSQEPRHFP